MPLAPPPGYPNYYHHRSNSRGTPNPIPVPSSNGVSNSSGSVNGGIRRGNSRGSIDINGGGSASSSTMGGRYNRSLTPTFPSSTTSNSYSFYDPTPNAQLSSSLPVTTNMYSSSSSSSNLPNVRRPPSPLVSTPSSSYQYGGGGSGRKPGSSSPSSLQVCKHWSSYIGLDRCSSSVVPTLPTPALSLVSFDRMRMVS